MNARPYSIGNYDNYLILTAIDDNYKEIDIFIVHIFPIVLNYIIAVIMKPCILYFFGENYFKLLYLESNPLVYLDNKICKN